jgi:subtilisin-like proprotein convertase family protein
MKKALAQAYSKTPKNFTRCNRALAAIAALSLSSAAFAITIVGTGGGAIPDNSFTGSTTRFDVAGVSGQQVSNVIVRMNMTHTWVGDLTAILIAPGDSARLRLFGRIGATRDAGSGDSSDVSGNYEFNDLGGSDIWVAAAGVPNSSSVPFGSYRTSTEGNGGKSNVGGCSSYLQLAFGGLRSNQINGQWQLLVVDLAAGDIGSMNAASTALEIQTLPETFEPPLFRSGFEDGLPPEPILPIAPILASSVVGNCTPGINSPTGSGLTDFVMVRNNAGALEWRVKANDLTASGLQFGPFVFGRNTDAIFMGDYDGDGYSDAAVWSPGTPGRFSVRRSSRPSDVPLQFNLGQTGDVAQIAADFDGDRVTDFAVFRLGTTGNPNVSYLIRKSTTGLVSSFPISNVANAIGFTLRDANSDGRADFSVQYNDGAGNGAFQIFSGLDGAFLSNFNFGLATDFVIPGQFVGDAVTDIAVSRNINLGANIKYAFTRDMATGEGNAALFGFAIPFGLVGDSIAQGDYDGDGIVDFAVWRASPTAGQSKFVIRRSSNVAAPLEIFQGEQGDATVNGWDVH